MNNYLVIKDAVEQFEITQYALRKAFCDKTLANEYSCNDGLC